MNLCPDKEMATREHLTCESVTAKLREFNGNMAAAARALGVVRSAVAMFVERHPTLKDVVRDCRESMKDHAESSLHRALLAGEAWAVCFYLKCQAKDRGYIERSEYTGAEGRALLLQIIRGIDEEKAFGNNNGQASARQPGVPPLRPGA